MIRKKKRLIDSQRGSSFESNVESYLRTPRLAMVTSLKGVLAIVLPGPWRGFGNRTEINPVRSYEHGRLLSHGASLAPHWRVGENRILAENLSSSKRRHLCLLVLTYTPYN